MICAFMHTRYAPRVLARARSAAHLALCVPPTCMSVHSSYYVFSSLHCTVTSSATIHVVVDFVVLPLQQMYHSTTRCAFLVMLALHFYIHEVPIVLQCIRLVHSLLYLLQSVFGIQYPLSHLLSRFGCFSTCRRLSTKGSGLHIRMSKLDRLLSSL
jgi:hypothetical protein